MHEQMVCLPAVQNFSVFSYDVCVCICKCVCVQESVAELYSAGAAHIAYNPVHVC